MKTAEIRNRFLKYFEQDNHKVVASSSLVPHEDPTLLFVNAGMVPFKNLFLGTEKADYVRATSSQRCVRAGGKHNDLENVGYTARHHTFFEMLGNFSFGDYFKREAIQYAWSFLTEELKIPAEKLWVTVFDKDDEAAEIWLNEIGVSKDRLSRIGEKDNFWSMGDVGPCGPCSEIFYDHGESVEGGPPGTPEEDGDRYIEIWNLVFMQYNRSADGSMTPLPKPSVDTGMGLERIAAVMQHVHNNYEIDLFDNLIEQICTVVGTKDRTHHSVRVIADHIRSCSFLIVDGVLPSNEGRGYVLRRIIRRAVRHGYQLGGQTPFFYKLVAPLINEMGDAYPELLAQKETIEKALEKEELRFAETLEQGLSIFEQKVSKLNGNKVPGELVFLLYDTYGFPVDLTADVARERDLIVDVDGFEVLMQEQRERARASSQFSTKGAVEFDVEEETNFVGFNSLKQEASVLGMKTQDGVKLSSATQDQSVVIVLDSTSFYAQGGGQVGDQGYIESSEAKVIVSDCQKLANGAFVHFGQVVNGSLNIKDKVTVVVDPSSRNATTANHSATHLMHAALKKVLGSHVNQKGSLVNPERLRFDFSHDAPMTNDEIIKLEAMVNQEIFSKHEVKANVMPIEQAKEAGAQALFGEKYGDEVRVVQMSDFSLELCGGTHVSNTSEIGVFKIISETGVAAGVRRIEALTGSGALEWFNQQNALLRTVSNSLKTEPDNLLKRIDQIQASVKTLEQDKKKLQQMLASGGGGQDLESELKTIGDISYLAVNLAGADKELMRTTIDQFKNKHANGVIVLAAEVDGKVSLMAGVSKTISKQYPAGKLIQYISGLVGGRGGGRPDMAEGGIPSVSDVPVCLEGVKTWVEQQIAG